MLLFSRRDENTTYPHSSLSETNVFAAASITLLSQGGCSYRPAICRVDVIVFDKSATVNYCDGINEMSANMRMMMAGRR